MVMLFLMSWLRGHLRTFCMNDLFLIICLQSLFCWALYIWLKERVTVLKEDVEGSADFTAQ